MIDLAESVNWKCRGCGCTDTQACPGGCSWVEPNLCSACVQDELPAPAPLPVLRICAADWHALPEAVLPTDDIGGGVTHDIYSATMFVSVERSASTIGRDLPAFYAVPQDLLAELQRALHLAQVQLAKAGRGLRPYPLDASKACEALAAVAGRLEGAE